MKDPSITWQRTFPESEPGTDGVAVFEGRIIGRIMHMTNLPRDPKPWSWSVTDPELAGQGRFVDASAAVLSRELMRARFELPIQDVIKSSMVAVLVAHPHGGMVIPRHRARAARSQPHQRLGLRLGQHVRRRPPSGPGAASHDEADGAGGRRCSGRNPPR